MVWIVDDLNDLALSIAAYISQAVQTLVNCFFYPFEVMFAWIGNIANLVYTTFVDVFASLRVTFDLTYNFMSDQLTAFFPSAWVNVVLIGFAIAFFLRLYQFIRSG